MTETGAILRDQLIANPFNRELRGIYADALDDGDRYLAAAFQRVLWEPRRDEWRLAYADLCESVNGDREYAEFIRVQCELAKTQEYEFRTGDSLARRQSDQRLILYDPNDPECGPRSMAADRDLPNEKHSQLRRREQELWPEICKSLRQLLVNRCPDQQWVIHFTALGDIDEVDIDEGEVVVGDIVETAIAEGVGIVTRGFVSLIICNWNQWAKCATTLVEVHPIEKVKLTTWPNLGWAFSTLVKYGVRSIQSLNLPPGRGATATRDKRRQEAEALLRHALQLAFPGIEFGLPAVGLPDF
ncbi:MAG TPA: hypothetical protein VLM40_08130 [Gemmata sp.]|nr:hypothetical protein [Gemmata sp.]